MKIIFITGGTGKLGKELVKIFPNSLHPKHEKLDIIDRPSVNKYIKATLPDIIVHTAALTSVKLCEENKVLAWKINVEGTDNLVKACLKFSPDCYFIYLSTACVFRGDRGDYVESDIPYPKNFYSLSKLLGEFTVKSSSLKKYLIIRTNFVARKKWPYPKAFIDRYGTYLFADELSIAIRSVIKKELKGIVHICGEEKMSMYELAKITTPDVQPMSLTEYDGPPLTVDMSLRSKKEKPYKINKQIKVKLHS